MKQRVDVVVSALCVLSLAVALALFLDVKRTGDGRALSEFDLRRLESNMGLLADRLNAVEQSLVDAEARGQQESVSHAQGRDYSEESLRQDVSVLVERIKRLEGLAPLDSQGFSSQATHDAFLAESELGLLALSTFREEFLDAGRDASYRMRALEMLRRFPAPMNAISPAVRSEAIRYLGSQGLDSITANRLAQIVGGWHGDDVKEALLRNTSHYVPGVRRSAVRALQRYWSDPRVPAAVRRVGQEDPEELVRAAARDVIADNDKDRGP